MSVTPCDDDATGSLGLGLYDELEVILESLRTSKGFVTSVL